MLFCARERHKAPIKWCMIVDGSLPARFLPKISSTIMNSHACSQAGKTITNYHEEFEHVQSE